MKQSQGTSGKGDGDSFEWDEDSSLGAGGWRGKNNRGRNKENEDKEERLMEGHHAVEVSNDEFEASAGEVLDLLYEILEADGQTPNGADLSKHDRARLRLVCAGGVLKMMRNQHVQHRLMTIPRYV